MDAREHLSDRRPRDNGAWLTAPRARRHRERTLLQWRIGRPLPRDQPDRALASVHDRGPDQTRLDRTGRTALSAHSGRAREPPSFGDALDRTWRVGARYVLVRLTGSASNITRPRQAALDEPMALGRTLVRRRDDVALR